MIQNTSHPAPSESDVAPSSPTRNRRITAGSILVVVGLALLGLQIVEGVGEAIWLFVIGTLFIGGYLVRRAYGLLVAGAIITGIGLGQVGEAAFTGVDEMTSIGLGVGFVAIYIIDRIYSGSSHWWPLIPGGILLATGLTAMGDPFSELFELAWPMMLIVVGLALLFGISAKRDRS